MERGDLRILVVDFEKTSLDLNYLTIVKNKDSLYVESYNGSGYFLLSIPHWVTRDINWINIWKKAL